jgi:hypothetical protein
MFLVFLITFIYIVQKNYYNKHNKILGKEVPKVPFLPVVWSILIGPHVEILKDIPNEYYQSGIYKVLKFIFLSLKSKLKNLIIKKKKKKKKIFFFFYL